MMQPFSRGKRTPGARVVLVLFGIAWLALALQPCTIALEGDAECPNCFPAMDRSGISHLDGSHSSAAPNIACAASGSDCAFADGYHHDSRGGQLRLKDIPNAAAAAIVETNLVLPNAPRAMLQDFGRYTVAALGTARPINVLYCVYLK